MDKQIIQIFKQVIIDYGLEICDNIKILNSLIADYSKGDYYKERKLIILILEANSRYPLNSSIEYDHWKKERIDTLYNEEFIDKNKSAWTMDILFDIVYGHEYYIEKGFIQLGKNKLNEANILFDNALNLQPNSSDAYYGKGEIAFKNNNLDKTIDFYTKSINYDNNKISLLSGLLGNAYFNRGLLFYNKKDYKSSLSDFNNSLKYMERSETYKYISICYHELSDFENEEKILTKALKLENNNIELLFLLGKASTQIKNYDKAINAYSKILTIDKLNIEIYELRSHIYFNLKDYNSALKDNFNILSIEASNSKALYHIALINFAVDDIQKSKEYLNKALLSTNNNSLIEKLNLLKRKIAIKESDHYEKIGDKCLNEGKSQNAIEAYDKAISCISDNSCLYFKRCYLLISNNDFEKAQNDLIKIIELSEDSIELLFAKGFQFYFKNDYEKAISNFDNLNKVSTLYKSFLLPFIINSSINAGMLYYKVGKYDEAILSYERVLENDKMKLNLLQNELANAYSKKAEVFFNKNDIKSAVLYYEKSYFYVNDNLVYLKLANCYNKLNDYASELIIYNKLISIDPNITEAYIKRSELYVIQKKYNIALNDYRFLLSKSKNNIDIHFKCLNVYILQNDLISAQNECDIILKMQPDNKEALYIKKTIDLNSSNYSQLLENRETWERNNSYREKTSYTHKCYNCNYLNNNIFICKKMEICRAWPFTKHDSLCHLYLKKDGVIL